ncbi:MAG TPA: alanyl-tRNA editing protein, partial [Gemmatimonadales bacterium]|nr:alanyl-tRNA editing protein [Gemmatimonadales bacterium]
MHTERLYYHDSYLTRFSAAVTDTDGGTRVYLDRTAFYPTSGGQPHDTGRLGDRAVLEVVDEGDRVAHLLDGPLPEGPVEGEVLWERRFDHMQQHTGQHLLSAVLANRFGFRTESVHFGPSLATLDLATASITPAQLREAELRANALVAEDRAVEVTFEEAAEADGLRKASTRTGTLRIVTIERLDRSACGGTHVRRTGEIGPILLRRTERVKQRVRVEFLCGQRAVGRARADYELLAELAQAGSAAVDEVPALFEKARADLKLAESRRRTAEEAWNGLRARDLYHTATPDAAGRRLVAVQEDEGSVEILRGLAQVLSTLPGAVFVGTLATPPTVVLAAAPDSGLDAGAVLKD